MNIEKIKKAGEELYHKLHLPTYPVGITYIKKEDDIPKQAIRPSSKEQKWSLCQAVTYARRHGWHVAMTADDNFCVPASAFHKWVDVSDEDLIESQVQQGWHKDRNAEQNRINYFKGLFAGSEGEKTLQKMKEYMGFVCSPLHQAIMAPDSILVYGDGTHINHMIQTLCFDYTMPVISLFDGFAETCFKGGLVPFITGRPQVVIPGMGDRAFAGITPEEIAVGFPVSQLPVVVENLFKCGGYLNIGQPVKTLLAMGLDESLTPGFTFLKNKIKEKSS
ncbi:MAG: DUF169 domain-containing protein [Desulfobacteraceae bacterium]|nr:DUF169 domain-containing protein [Desulfobacteraceae bacterium]MBC2757671.1 DUF169 domain-containing protein [Desulfobacteraceae bacterium]